MSGQLTRAEVCREHQLSPTLLATWLGVFEKQGPAIFDPNHGSELEARLAEYQRLGGQLSMDLEILRKALNAFPSSSYGQ